MTHMYPNDIDEEIIKTNQDKPILDICDPKSLIKSTESICYKTCVVNGSRYIIIIPKYNDKFYPNNKYSQMNPDYERKSNC